MFTLILLAFLGCDLEQQYKAPPKRPRPPKRERDPRDKPRPDMDTGEALGSGLLETVRYEPERPHAFEDLTVIAKVNKEGRGYVDVDVSWAVNGRTLLSQRDTILGHTQFSKGDAIQATVTVTAQGQEVSQAGPVIIVANTPPRILTRPSSLTKLDGFRVRAEDPDGGRVTYSIKSGPPGLTIGESTGVCRYAPSKKAEGGAYDLSIIVADEDGGESEWRMKVSISAGSDSPSAKAKRAKAKADWEAKRAAEREAAERRESDEDED